MVPILHVASKWIFSHQYKIVSLGPLIMAVMEDQR